MDSRELSGWQAYYALEPWGPERDDQRIAHITVRLANYLRDKDQEPYQLEDFILGAKRRPKKPQSVEQQVAIAKGLAKPKKEDA